MKLARLPADLLQAKNQWGFDALGRRTLQTVKVLAPISEGSSLGLLDGAVESHGYGGRGGELLFSKGLMPFLHLTLR